MKNYYFILLLFFSTVSISRLTAQKNNEARSGRIAFLYTNRYSLYIPGRANTTDSAYLYFNDTASSYYIVQKVPTYEEVLQKSGNQASMQASIPDIIRRMEEKQSRHFYFHKAGTETISAPWNTPLGDKWYCVQDTIKAFTWELFPDTMRILGFVCQKAVFRSSALGNIERPYTAWFAPDIAYSYGPFRFFGLPGMILQLDNQYYQYRAVSIDLPLPKEGMFPITCCSGLPSITKKQSEQIASAQRKDVDNMRKVQKDKN